MRQEKLEAKETKTKEKPVFFTNVDLAAAQKENTAETLETKKDIFEGRETRSVQSLRRPINRDGLSKGKFEKSHANISKKGKHPPWMKKKRGPKFLLDFRRTKPEQTEEINPPDQKQLYYDHPLPNRETYFIPKLKGPRNPQLAKIQAYFVNFSYLV